MRPSHDASYMSVHVRQRTIQASSAFDALHVSEGAAFSDVQSGRGHTRLGLELLDGEEEGHALASGHLHSDGRIVDAVLLLEVHIAAAVHVELAANLRGRGARSEDRLCLQ